MMLTMMTRDWNNVYNIDDDIPRDHRGGSSPRSAAPAESGESFRSPATFASGTHKTMEHLARQLEGRGDVIIANCVTSKRNGRQRSDCYLTATSEMPALLRRREPAFFFVRFALTIFSFASQLCVRDGVVENGNCRFSLGFYDATKCNFYNTDNDG